MLLNVTQIYNLYNIVYIINIKTKNRVYVNYGLYYIGCSSIRYSFPPLLSQGIDLVK